MRTDELDQRLGALAEEGARHARPPAAAAIGRRSRRRRRRQAAGVVLLGLALAGAVVIAQASPPISSRPVAPPTPTTQAPAVGGGIVPWSSAPPRPPAPVGPAAVVPGTPSCTADRLHATAGWEGATGSLAGWVRLTSRDRAGCRLRGYPAIQLLDEQGRALPTRTGRAGGQVTGVLLRPGTAATVAFFWSNWCGPNPGRLGLRLTLPDGSSLVPAVEAGTPRGLTARCDAPGAPSTLSRGPFAPQPPEPPPSPLEGLTATVGLPPTAVAGQPLRYTVTLTNPTQRPVSLRDCPNYTEAVLLRDGGKAVERHLLNCGPASAIGPGQRVTFAMVLQLPARLRSGPGVLTWVLDSVGVGRKVPVTVTGP
jgi:hypothetical protein